MDRKEFKAFLKMLMEYDSPYVWKTTSDGLFKDESNYEVLIKLANDQANAYGYTNWIDAYHGLQ